ncbi:hypothetical protein BC941DRAFT_485447 [Chlamydoabsidia padenii]|nr:hypothetical protein BC941DRAFT_485447 [Chlamydoabsidia padenii]
MWALVAVPATSIDRSTEQVCLKYLQDPFWAHFSSKSYRSHNPQGGLPPHKFGKFIRQLWTTTILPHGRTIWYKIISNKVPLQTFLAKLHQQTSNCFPCQDTEQGRQQFTKQVTIQALYDLFLVDSLVGSNVALLDPADVTGQLTLKEEKALSLYYFLATLADKIVVRYFIGKDKIAKWGKIGKDDRGRLINDMHRQASEFGIHIDRCEGSWMANGMLRRRVESLENSEANILDKRQRQALQQQQQQEQEQEQQ